MLSQTSEYALRAIVVLAQQADRAQTTREIAKLSRVPIGYLAKIMRQLGRVNLVSSQRGIHGGFMLMRPANEISMYDVVHAVDPVAPISSLPSTSDGARRVSLTRLYRRIDQVSFDAEQAFKHTAIADLLTDAKDTPSE